MGILQLARPTQPSRFSATHAAFLLPLCHPHRVLLKVTLNLIVPALKPVSQSATGATKTSSLPTAMRSRERRTLRISIASLVLEELFTSCVAAIRGLLLEEEEEEEEEYFLRFIQVLCRISHSSPTGDSWFTGDWTWFGLRRPSARGQVFANSSTREAPVVVYGDSFPSCEKENWRPIWRGNRFVGLLH